MPADLHEHVFEDPAPCLDAAAAFMRATLQRALDRTQADGTAVGFMISGGRTPREILPRLAQAPLDWTRVVVTPSDERLVPAGHVDSTTGMARTLLTGPAAAARIVGLDGASDDAVQLYRTALASVPRPLALSFLGMGEDGHMASLFPGRPDDLTRTDALCFLVPETPPHRHPRMTHSLASLLEAEAVVLVVAGAAKRAAYERARMSPYPTPSPGALPISALLHRPPVPVHVFLCP